MLTDHGQMPSQNVSGVAQLALLPHLLLRLDYEFACPTPTLLSDPSFCR